MCFLTLKHSLKLHDICFLMVLFILSKLPYLNLFLHYKNVLIHSRKQADLTEYDILVGSYFTCKYWTISNKFTSLMLTNDQITEVKKVL
jgi:hypothetical protein